MRNDFPRIHPDLQQIAQKAPKLNFNRWTVWFVNMMMSLIPVFRTPNDIIIENVFIHSQPDQAKIRLRIYKPKSSAAPTPVLIWFHGGEYVIGNPEMDDSKCTQYVRELGITVVSAHYRLAPRHPFPAALDDGYAVLKWVVSCAQQLGVDAEHLAVGGGSAGGGLAAALAQLAYDRQEIKPVLQLLAYPMLDDRTILRCDIDDSSNVTVTKEDIRFGWESYLGQECGSDYTPAYSVSARRIDLSGMPPAWIGIGELDVCCDEAVAYAQRLTEAGVECQTVIVPGAFHGFDDFDQQNPLVRDFRKSQIAALRKYLFR